MHVMQFLGNIFLVLGQGFVGFEKFVKTFGQNYCKFILLQTGLSKLTQAQMLEATHTQLIVN